MIKFSIPDDLKDSSPPDLIKVLSLFEKCINNIDYINRIDDKYLNNVDIIIAIGKNSIFFVYNLLLKMLSLRKYPSFIYIFQPDGYVDNETIKQLNIIINKMSKKNNKLEFNYFKVSHPFPTENTIKYTSYVISKLLQLNSHTIHFLVTGGGSASFAIPEATISFDLYTSIIKKAMQFGYNIYELNFLRNLIDGVKGGKFSYLLRHHTIYTWAISDIIDDNISIVASGPSVAPYYPEYAKIRVLTDFNNVIKKYKLYDIYKKIEKYYSDYNTSISKIILSREDLINCVAAELENLAYNSIIIDKPLKGEINSVVEFITSIIKKYNAGSSFLKTVDPKLSTDNKPIYLIFSGEWTVKLDENSLYNQPGGRLSALVFLLSFNIDNEIIAIATDGKDGFSPAAGYIITRDKINKIRQINKTKFTESGKILKDLKCTFDTGITNYNLLDVVIVKIK